MAYTLLSTPTLCFDLVRMERGERLASLLLTALSLGEGDLRVLASAHPGRQRARRWSETQAQAAAQRAADSVSLLEADGAGAGKEAAALLLARLERSRLGTLDSLDALVRREILGWTWAEPDTLENETSISFQSSIGALAADVLMDSIAAAYCDSLEPALRRSLEEPFQLSRFEIRDGHPLDLPHETSALLIRLAALDDPSRTRLRETLHDQRRRLPDWAPAMHDATWAVDVAGRSRIAAAAQLLGVLAFARAGFSGRDGAYGLWNTVSGAIQASVVADLLGDEPQAMLTDAWNQAVSTR